MSPRAWALVAAILVAGVTAGQAQAFGSAPDRTYATDGSVRAMLRVGNTVYLGGNFTRVAPRTGAGAQLDTTTGQPRAGFAEVTGGQIIASSPDGSGGWYIGGDFTHVGGLVRHGLAHIRPDGTVDPAFNPSPSLMGPYPASVDALWLWGSSLFVGGNFDTIGGQPRNNLAAVNATTGAATSWNPDVDGDVDTIVVQSSLIKTTVYVGGFFTHVGGVERDYLAAIDAVGGAPTSWAPNPDSYVRSLTYSGGFGITPLTVYVGGDFSMIGGAARSYIAAVNGSGSAISTWNPGANNSVYSLTYSGGTVFAGGSFTTMGGQPRVSLAAISSAGAVLPWHADTNSLGYVTSVGVSGGALYAAGGFSSVGGVARENLAAVNPSTGAVLPWNPSPFGTVETLALSGTSVFAGGAFGAVGGVARNGLAAIDAVTGAPTSWNPNATGGGVSAFALSGSTLYIGGGFTSVGGQLHSSLAALNLSTGQPLPTWRADTNGIVDSLAVSSTTVYAGGTFSLVGGATRNRIAALDASSGAVLPTWDVNASFYVYALALSGGTLYVGGNFTMLAGQPHPYLAQVNAATGAVSSWNPQANGSVYALTLSGSTLYVGGLFSKIGVNGKTRNHLAALDAAGNATDWDPNADSVVYSISLGPGLVYAGGDFQHVGGQSRGELAELGSSTGQATSWNPSAPANQTVYSVLAAGDTLYAGGNFTSLDLGGQQGFASFSTAPHSTAPPAVSGTARVGQALACSTGGWSGTTHAFTFAWLLDGGPIAGATSTGYTVPLSAGGHTLACRVSANNLAGRATATSASVQVPPNCIVPKLKGKTLKKARAALKRAHCALGRVHRGYSKVKKGRVLAQRPKAHTVLPGGTKVNVTLSRGRKHKR